MLPDVDEVLGRLDLLDSCLAELRVVGENLSVIAGEHDDDDLVGRDLDAKVSRFVDMDERPGETVLAWVTHSGAPSYSDGPA